MISSIVRKNILKATNKDTVVDKISAENLSRKLGLGSGQRDFLFKPSSLQPCIKSGLYRSDLYSIGLIEKGAAVFTVGINMYDVTAPGIILVSPGEIRSWQDNLALPEITSIFFTEDFMLAGHPNHLFLKSTPVEIWTTPHFLPLTANQFETLKAIFNLIESKYFSAWANRLKTIPLLLQLVLIEISSLRPFPGTEMKPGTQSQGVYLTERFKTLLSKNFMLQRRVEYYADQLFVSPQYLTQTIIKETGKTTKQLIDEMVCREAKALLKLSEYTIDQISNYLNFPNPSFFGKFFRRNTGVSPIYYRKSTTENEI